MATRKTFLILLGLFLPVFTFAHIKWFVGTEEVISQSHGKVPFFSLTDPAVIIWIILIAAATFIAIFLEKIIPTPPLQFIQKAREWQPYILWVFQAFIGLFLIVIAFYWKIILVPEFPIKDILGQFFQVIEIATGLLLILNLAPRLAAIFLILLYLAMGFFVGWLSLLEGALVLGIAIFLLIKRAPSRSVFHNFIPWAVPILRVSAGISLIVLAFTEKIIYPELSLRFLSEHHWNFMQLLGFSWFSDPLFVLSAGCMEILFGIIFILGVVTRINTVAIAAFFATSVTAMFLTTGQWEVEDLLIYAAAIIFIFLGSGERLKITNLFKKK